MKNIFGIIWELFQIILIVMFIAIVCFCTYRFFNMNAIDTVTFELAKATNGAVGVAKWFMNDIHNTISTIL